MKARKNALLTAAVFVAALNVGCGVYGPPKDYDEEQPKVSLSSQTEQEAKDTLETSETAESEESSDG